MAPFGDGYRQQGEEVPESELTWLLSFLTKCHFYGRLCAKQSSWCGSGSFLLTRWRWRRLVVGEGEVLVSGGESGEDEGVDERLGVVESPQQRWEGGRWYGPGGEKVEDVDQMWCSVKNVKVNWQVEDANLILLEIWHFCFDWNIAKSYFLRASQPGSRGGRAGHGVRGTYLPDTHLSDKYQTNIRQISDKY